MPPLKTYGKRSAAAPPGAAAIFGAAAEPTSPLADLTSAVNDLSLREEVEEEDEYTAGELLSSFPCFSVS